MTAYEKNLRDRISEVLEEIAVCEVRIAIPPARCAYPELYQEVERKRLAVLYDERRGLLARLGQLDAQMVLSI